MSLFLDDDETDCVVMIGEIGGQLEVEASKYVLDNGNKPVIGFIAGETAQGRTMGHAGAVGGDEDTASAKKNYARMTF